MIKHENNKLSRAWASNYLSNAIIDLMSVSLVLRDFVSEEQLRRSNFNLGRDAEAPRLNNKDFEALRKAQIKLDKVTLGTLSDLQSDYFFKQDPGRH